MRRTKNLSQAMPYWLDQKDSKGLFFYEGRSIAEVQKTKLYSDGSEGHHSLQHLTCIKGLCPFDGNVIPALISSYENAYMKSVKEEGMAAELLYNAYHTAICILDKYTVFLCN